MRPTDWGEVFGFSDPTPGEAYEIRAVSRRWGTVADDAEYAEGKLRGLFADAAVRTWIGKAGEAFAAHSSELPDQLGKAKDSYRRASDAMYWWAGRLELHQGDADSALVRGRQAKIDLEQAQSQLSSAMSAVSSAGGAGALNYTGAADNPHAPTPAQVNSAQNALHSAQASQSHAQGLVNDAQGRLDLARQMAQDAGHLRESDGRSAASKIHDAADAGIKPRGFWDKMGDGLASAWHVIVEVAKVVVAVLGVVALIIGGPIAWIVFAAALIVLADTLMKYAKGEASLLDVALAALACIPMTKGLTTLSKLSAAFKSGGLLGAGSHLAGAVKAAGVGLVTSVRALKNGAVPGVKAAIAVLGKEGALAIPELRTTLREMTVALKTSVEGEALVLEARGWQGTKAFPGVDDYKAMTLPAGTKLEAGFPGVGTYAMPEGTAAAHGNSASGVWEAVQVGPQDAASAYPGYRGSLIELRVNNEVAAAGGPTLANPQYGAGGSDQFYLHINDQIANGNISVLDQAGNAIDIPKGTTADGVGGILKDNFGHQGTITLNGSHTWNPNISTQQDVVAAHPDLSSSGIGTITPNEIRQVLGGTGVLHDQSQLVQGR